MNKALFKLLLIIIAIIRGPLSVLLIVLKNFIRPLSKRIIFERQNLLDEVCRSFNKDNVAADYCFEVSSEGELEQVRPLIEYFLVNNKRIEIIFSSPSVEKKVIKMALDQPDKIRVLRLPVASFFPFPFLYFQSLWFWVSASKIIFCRYDFYPELLSLKYLGKKFILLSAASKKPSWFKDRSYELFDVVVAATPKEEKFFQNKLSNVKTYTFDFRVPRIFERLALAPSVLSSIPEINEYLSYLKSRGPKDLLILGSSWESDLDILKNNKIKEDILSSSLHILIVPHNLSAQSLLNHKSKLKSFFRDIPIYEISSNTATLTEKQLAEKPGMVLLNKSGILCELYSLFSFAYVGGGFERSIHSCLEPFLSGAQVCVGPAIHRSTEFDFINEFCPEEIHLLKNPESFYNLWAANKNRILDLSKRDSLKEFSRSEMESILNAIETC